MDPLEQLRPLHLPAAVSWWPPAPGWWLLAVLAVAALTVTGIWLRRWQRGRRYRRTALRELALLHEQTNPHVFAAAANQLLRRAALARYPRAEVAGLCLDAWLSFLDRSGNTREFTAGAGRALATAAYDPAADCDIDALNAVCRDWLRQHQ